jgi:hypothetical protein
MMQNRTYIFTLLILTFLFLGSLFLFLYTHRIPDVDLPTPQAAEPVFGKKVTDNVKEDAIAKIIEEKRKIIEKKPINKPYTQDDIDFLLSPRKNAEKELANQINNQ